MNATTTHEALSSISAPIAVEPVGTVSGAPRLLLRLEGAAALLAGVVAYSVLGGRWGMFALLFLVPDLSMLGYLVGRRVGAACYNAGHSYLGPALVAGLAAASSAHGVLLVACIWAAHIGFDRMLGYGLKYGTSFGDSHLSRKG